MDIAQHLLNQSYTDLLMSEEQRGIVVACLALSEIYGETMRDVAKRILRLLGNDFHCPSLIEYIKSKPRRGMFKKVDPTDLLDVIEIYAMTKLFEASNKLHLDNMLGVASLKAVEILQIKDSRSCGKCSRIAKRYSKKNLNILPKLPLHWGCRCSYMARFD